MTHMLDFAADGTARLAYAGEVPWHRLGIQVSPDLSPDEMLEVSQNDWTVEKVPLVYARGGQLHKSGQNALIRSSDGRMFDTVSDEWNPLQNKEAFKFFTQFVEAGEASMEVVGSMRGGSYVWGLAKLNDTFEINGKDVVESYMLLTNPHKFGAAIDVRLTNIRAVCNNTVTMALQERSDNVVKVNHRQVFDADEVKATLGVAREKIALYKEAAEFLSSKHYNHDTLESFLNDVFPSMSSKNNKAVSKNAKLCLDLIDQQPGAEMAPGSWWNAYNVCTFATNHLLGRNDDTRLTSNWYGINSRRNQKALMSALEYAEAA